MACLVSPANARTMQWRVAAPVACHPQLVVRGRILDTHQFPLLEVGGCPELTPSKAALRLAPEFDSLKSIG